MNCEAIITAIENNAANLAPRYRNGSNWRHSQGVEWAIKLLHEGPARLPACAQRLEQDLSAVYEAKTFQRAFMPVRHACGYQHPLIGHAHQLISLAEHKSGFGTGRGFWIGVKDAAHALIASCLDEHIEWSQNVIAGMNEILAERF